MESLKMLDVDSAAGREPVASVMSIVRRVKQERRESNRGA
jgi:hypothetical protein